MYDKFIEFNSMLGKIRGVLHYPDYFCEFKKNPCVIINVGLNGNRCDLNRILVQFARKIQQMFFLPKILLWRNGYERRLFF